MKHLLSLTLLILLFSCAKDKAEIESTGKSTVKRSVFPSMSRYEVQNIVLSVAEEYANATNISGEANINTDLSIGEPEINNFWHDIELRCHITIDVNKRQTLKTINAIIDHVYSLVESNTYSYNKANKKIMLASLGITDPLLPKELPIEFTCKVKYKGSPDNSPSNNVSFTGIADIKSKIKDNTIKSSDNIYNARVSNSSLVLVRDFQITYLPEIEGDRTISSPYEAPSITWYGVIEIKTYVAYKCQNFSVAHLENTYLISVYHEEQFYPYNFPQAFTLPGFNEQLDTTLSVNNYNYTPRIVEPPCIVSAAIRNQIYDVIYTKLPQATYGTVTLTDNLRLIEDLQFVSLNNWTIGIDLDFSDLVWALEREFSIIIPEQDATQFTTVGKICSYIAAHGGY